MRGIYIFTLSVVLVLSAPDRVGAQNLGDLIPGEAAIYHIRYGHYLDLLYKQVLVMCSLYWLLAGYRRYRPGKIPDNHP